MPSYSMEAFDNGDTTSSNATLTKRAYSRGPGCYVSSMMGFVFILLAMLLAVGIGIIVHFAQSRDITCNFGNFEMAESAAIKACQDKIQSGGSAATEICKTCQPSTTAALTTTTALTTSTTTAATPTYPRNKYRLPRTVVPSHYTLRLQPFIYGDDPKSFYFEGNVTITVTCREATDVITLHVDRLEIQQNDVTVQPVGSAPSVSVRNISYEQPPHFYHIHLSASLVANQDYRIRFARFRGNLSTDGEGLYISSYRDGEKTVYLATTQMEAPYARKTLPCFDEPALKATFDTTLVRKTSNVDRSYLTLSNMPQTGTNPIGEWTEDVYQRTPVMSTYLLAFIVCDYGYKRDTIRGIAYSTWARKNALEYAQRAHDHGLKLFNYFDSHFKPNYSTVINKLDNIAIPDFNAGAMENWGLITYREGLLYKPGVAGASDEDWIAEVIGHEIAHMWFGNIVSPLWWGWLWLNEALASFWDFHSVGEVYPSWRKTDMYIATGLHMVMVADALASSHPMSADVETRQEISSIFDDITYTKGSLIIRMMHFIMGQDKFIEGLNVHLQRKLFSSAEHKDLWNALNEVSMTSMGRVVNMSEVMDPWVTQMGYPVVTVTKTLSGFHLTQKRFLLGSESTTDDRYKNPPYKYQWEIPITFTTDREKNFNKTGGDIQWLHKNQTLNINANGAVNWVVVNVQQFGYYRVNYEVAIWEALIQQLKTDHTVIHPINRAQIINDAWNLVKGDLLDMSIALKTLDYLSKELDYVPWRAFAREMDYVELMLDRSILYSDLEKFIQDTVSHPLKELGLEITEGAPLIDVFAKIQIADYSCGKGHTTCVNMAKQQFSDWRRSGTNNINPNLRYRFYCTAIKNGGIADWNFVYEKYKAEDDATENARLRRALACTSEPSLLLRLLTMTFNTSEIRTQDIRTTIQAVAANRWGRDIAYHFVAEHFVALSNVMSAVNMNRLIASVTAHFNSDYHLTQLNTLASGPGVTPFIPAINQARAQTQTNKDWLNKHFNSLETWLKSQGPAPGEKINYRLPTNVIPEHYDVRLQPYIYGTDPSKFYFEGSCTITVVCKSVTNTITLHMDRLNISQADVSVMAAEGSSSNLLSSITYDIPTHFYRLTLSQSLAIDRKYNLTFRHFTGPLTTDGNGLYYSYYPNGSEHVYLATTQMEMIFARKTFPCFDEPGMKATFDIKLVYRRDTGRDYKALSNMNEISQAYFTQQDGTQWIESTFNRSVIMPTYLLAFIICDYKYLENETVTEPKIKYRTWARPNAIQWAERAQNYGIQMYHWLDRHFKPPYGAAIPKLDNIAVPDFNFGAMENWGLITYRETLLYQPGVTSASTEYWMGTVIAHEIAHMWFGDYVSPLWWNWLWLNEAFASWWDVYTPNQVFPKWRVVDEWVPASVHGVMATDSLASSHPLTADAESPTEINALFDGITYDKGAAVLRMIHFVMNETNFISGLNRYLDKKKFGNAQTSDLWSALDQEASLSLQINISARMDPWVTQMGLPVVTVTRNGNSFSLTQKRFLIGSLAGTDPRYRDPPYNYQWEIPVVYCTSSNPSYDKTNKDVQWLSKNSTLTIPATASDEWILVNVQQIGYFRVQYDIENWQAIIRQLNRDHRVFHPLNRGQIINDAWNLVKAGMLNMSIALGTLDFLQSETDYVAWRAFSREFDYLDLMIERTDLYEKLTNFMLETVRTPMSRLTLTITDNMPPIDVFVRTLIARYACTYGHVGCINDAKRLFAQFKNTGVNTIDPNLRRQFYCTAVAEGTKSDWEFVYKQFKSNDDSTELTNLRYALSCTRDPSLLRKLLTMSLNTSEIRTQDIATTVQWVAANPLGRDFAFQFFVDNYEKFEKSLDVLYLGRTFLSVTSHFNTEYNLQQLQQFSEIRGNAAVGTVLEQAMAQTRSNIAWLKANYDQIKQWLENRVPAVTPTPEKKYRLPTDLKPRHYKLELQPHIYGNDTSKFYFEGSVTITFSCVNTTSTITLHEDRLDIDNSSISVNDTSSNSIVPITEFTKETTYHFYHIKLGRELEIGKNYTVTFPYFRGAMRQSGEGLYLSSYKDGSNTIYLATTQMEATYARQVFPCFDEPAMKATFETTLVRRTDYMNRNYITLSNKPIKNSRIINSSWTADEFETTMIMPTYLLAFIVCDYRYWDNTIVDPKTNQTIESRTYVRPNRYSEAERAQKFSIEIFQWFNFHFEPPYQKYLSKVDHIAIPDFTAGAMENWGLITYREALLYNSYSRASDLSWIATVISHELAHMWFGNKVSPLWWDWLWLNEAFASYWEYYVVDRIYPSWKLHEVELTASVFSAMQTDSYSTSHPMTNPVESPSEIDNQFDTIAYTKGGAIIAMMHYIMGENFIPALNSYLIKHQTGNAEHKNLLDSLDEYSRSNNLNLNMTNIIEPWILQMGYPVVKVERINGATLRFSQQRFLLGTTTANDTGKFGYKYEIPITYTTDIEKNFSKSWNEIRWLHKSSNLDLQLNNSNAKWVIVNQRHQGYFRVLYDTENWLAIINQLNTDHTVIDEINRATIIDDAWNLVKANMLNLSIALQTIDYMKKETEYGPWRTFARELDYMESMIERSELFKDFKRFMQDLVDEPLKRLTLTVPPSNEPPVKIYTQVWVARDACLYEHLTCVNEAKRLVNNWKNGQENTININLRQDFYCTAIREGDQDVWDFIYKKYQEETVSTEKSLLRNALGCSKDPTVLMTFLDMCLYDDEVPRSETPNCVSAVAANRYGRDVALNFVMENFPMLQKGLPSSLGTMVLTVTAFFHTEFHLSQLQFLTDTYDVSGITSQLERAKQRTLTNIRWLQNNFQIVKEWLTRKVRPPPTQISDYRLPKTIVPHHYNLFLQPEIYSTNVSDFKFNGSVEILIECVETTNVVTLHAYSNLEIDDARLQTASGTELEIVKSTRDIDRQFVMFGVNQNLTVKANYWLKLQFSAKQMISDGVGLYYSSYQDRDQTVYLATTKFEAPYARRAFPCFDEPALKATFNTTLIRRETWDGRNYSAWSNNDLQDSNTWAVGYSADRFHTTPKTSTYLLAFIVSDFKCLSDTILNVKYRTCARPNAYQFGQLAQEYGVKEFKWLEDHFEPKYIMPKLDNFAIPDFLSGAMENWGLITYREDLLYEDKVTTASIKDWIVEVVAHELAHMWFGNIVSPKWWDWLWLNEAFASFWDFHIVEVFEPTWKMTEQFIVQSLHSTMATDSLQSSHPLTADVESPSQIQAIFDSITYNKGAAFVRMMHFILGEDEFIRLLNIYLDNRNYNNAEHQDLWDALDRNNLTLNMTDLMDPWVTQMNYPVVNVTRVADDQFVLTQSRFLSSASGASDQAPYGYKWDIPITYATNLNPQFNISGSNITWFRKTAPQVSLFPGSSVSWILVNIQQYGIYRVNYEEDNWKKLIKQLEDNHTVIHPINRAQIINDAWSLAKAGQLNMSIALSTINFLKQDDDYTPWRAMAGELDYLDLMLSNTETYGQFKDYMKSLVNGTFLKLGMKGVKDESLIFIFQRQRIVSYACKYGIEECTNNATQQFTDWQETGTNEIDVDLRSIIYCYGIRYGTDKDWEFALETYKKSSSSSERSNLQSSLACSQQPWLIKRFLDLTLDSSVIRNQDVRAAILSVSSNPIGRQMAWDFFQEHFVTLSKYMTPGNYGSMILSLTAHFNTEFQLKQVEQFIANNDVTSAQSTFRQVVEQTNVNINWMTRYHNLIKDWLKTSI